MKGYIFTLDSMFALLLTLTIVILISSQVFEPRVSRDMYLKQISEDTLTVLEKSGGLGQFATGTNNTPAREILRLSSESICIKLELYDEHSLNKSIVKSNCNQSSSGEIEVFYRFYTRGNDNYFVKSYAWYAGE